MKNTGIHALAQHLQAQGRGRDTILAHIMPEEAAMLKRMGGSGTVNPRTGLLEFSKPDVTPLYDPRKKDRHPHLKIEEPIPGTSERMSKMRVDVPVRWASAPNHPSAHLAYITDEEAALLRKADLHGSNIDKEDHIGPAGIPSYQGGGIGGGGGGYSAGGGQDSPSESGPGPGMGGGGGMQTGGGGGGGMLGGPNAGGNAGGMQTGGGGGSLAAGRAADIASVPGYAASGNSSSNYAQSLGVPTIVANAAQNIAGAAQAAGQGLLNFSDWATGQYRQMMNPAVSSFPARPDLQEVASAAPTTQSNIDPITGRDYGLEATRRSIAWGELIGGGISSLRDALSAPQGTAPTTPGFRSEAASGVYDFTPATPNVPTIIDPGGSGRMVSPSEAELFNEMQRERFADQYGTQPSGIPAPQPIESIRLDQASPLPSTAGLRSEASAGEYAITPVSLPGFRSEAALDVLTAPAATPSLEGLPPGRLGTFDMQTAIEQYRQALNNIQVPTTFLGAKIMVNPGPYANDPKYSTPDNPETNYYQTDAQIAQSIMKNLPLAGLKVADDGSIVTSEGGMPSGEQMAKVAELAAKQYTVPQAKMPEGSTGQMTLDPRQFVDVRSVPMPPERGIEAPVEVAGPPGFRSEVAQNVAQSLDAEFENLTKSASLIEGPQPSGLRSEILSEGYGYTAPAPTTRGITAPEQMTGNLPTFAQVPIGTPRAFPETPAAMQYEGQYQPPTPTGLPAFIEAAGINANSTPAQISGALANMSTRQIYNILDETERMRRTLESTTGPFKVRENAAVTRGVDPRLLDIARKESVSLPQGQYYEFTSGVRPGDTGVHSTGRALDVAIMTADGQRLPNYQNPVFFSNYEQPALVGRAIQQQIYPELANNYYWGGYFSGPKGVYGALDVMDRRIGGNRPLGGSWETGLTEKQAALWGLPAGVTQVAQTKGVTSPEATQAAIQEGKLSNLLEYTYSGLRSEILTEGYNPPSESVTGYRDALRALGYTEEQIDRVEGVSDLPATTATPSSANLLEESSTFPSIGGGGGGGSRPSYGRPSRPGELPIEEPPVPVYTTGMNLARQTYTPRLPSETLSPAYP